MNEPIYMADTGLETIIYIIAVFLWLLGNLFSNARRKKRGKGGGTPIPRPDETPAERELREFLESLAGKPDEAQEEPPPTLAPPPAPAPAAVRRTGRRRDYVRPEDAVSAPVVPVQRVLRPEPDIPVIDIEAVARQMRDAAPSMASSMSTSLSSHGNLFKAAGQPLPSLRHALGSNRPPPARPILRRDQLRDPDNLRNLVAAQFILGPPRAFSPIDPGASRNL